MVIKQILNNNIISCTDELGEEVLLMGKDRRGVRINR